MSEVVVHLMTCLIKYVFQKKKKKDLNLSMFNMIAGINESKTLTKYISCEFKWKWMYILIEDDDLLEKYSTFWDKVSSDIKKELDREHVYNKIFLKTKIRSHGDEVEDFCDEKIPKVNSNHTCLAVISLDSALKKD